MMLFQGNLLRGISKKTDRREGFFFACVLSGLELERVPGTRQNSEHHLRHPRILRFLIITGTHRAHSMQQVAPSVSNF